MGLVKINLSGIFAELAGVEVFEVMASTAREAISYLEQFPKLNPRQNSKRYLAKIKQVDTQEQLDAPLTVNELTLIPQGTQGFGGSGGNGGVLRIIVGVILLVVGFLLAGKMPIFGKALMAAGIGMILGGIYALLFPPEDPEEKETQRSFDLASQNTTKSGTPIPIILGEHKFAGHLLSFNVDSVAKGSSSTPQINPQSGWKRVI